MNSLNITSVQLLNPWKRTAEEWNNSSAYRVYFHSSRRNEHKEDTIDIEIIWKMIGDHPGEIFSQIRGREFTYVMKGNAVIPDRTNVQISKAHFIEALEHYPLSNTVPLQKLRGPLYIYAILMDKRICQDR